MMDKLKLKYIVVGAAVLLILAYFLSNILAGSAYQGGGLDALQKLAKEPIIIVILGPLIAFLFYDRWKEMKADISEIRKNRDDSIQDLRDELKEVLNSRIDTAIQKARALDSKISRVVEDHPWIASITESEYIPSVSSCKIVLLTAEDLVKKERLPSAYEYLYGWLSNMRAKDVPNLEGNFRDFLELADFCEFKLEDEYLALRITEEAHMHANDKALSLPAYLKMLVRQGKLEKATSIAASLLDKVQENWWSKLKAYLLNNISPYGARFSMQAYAALALYEALLGHKKLASKYLSQADEWAESLNLQDEARLLKAEINIVFGKYAEAERLFEEVDVLKSWLLLRELESLKSRIPTSRPSSYDDRQKTQDANGKSGINSEDTKEYTKATQHRDADGQPTITRDEAASPAQPVAEKPLASDDVNQPIKSDGKEGSERSL